MIPEKKVMLQSPAIKPARNLYLQLLSPQSISIILSALFCLLISLLFFARGTTQALPATVSSTPPAVIHTDPRAVIHADPPAPLQGSPTTAAIVQRTLPAPIYPFPRDVRQQVGVLERYHRFFFGGNPAQQEIALTFDDGPYPPYTGEILAVLKKYNVKASFFDIGHHIAEHPELVKQEFDEGHTVAIHSWNHVYLTGYSPAGVDEQINNTSVLLKKTIGIQPKFFRPPYGAYNTTVLTEANKLGLTTFLWNDVASDWLRPGVTVISSRIINAARNGSIVLLHDGDGDHYNAVASREQTVQALPTIIITLKARGYRFVTLDQLVADMHA